LQAGQCRRASLDADLDKDGNVVSITIEHASAASDMREFLYQKIPAAISP